MTTIYAMFYIIKDKEDFLRYQIVLFDLSYDPEDIIDLDFSEINKLIQSKGVKIGLGCSKCFRHSFGGQI